jgi:periplasmic divalent cation tolerance protein
MKQTEYIVVFITTGNIKEAEKISDKLIKDKLAACANMIPKMKSVFSWKGKIEEANEQLLIVKTKLLLFRRLVKAVKKLHSYEVPEIIALPIIEGNEAYLNWIKGTVKKY